jgi:glutamine amidotransferase
MIAIIDYGMGNLRSVQKALEKSGGKTLLTQNPKDIDAAEKIVLPGVGAMKPAMEKLYGLELVDVIKSNVAKGKPFLGICLGLQLLFEKGFEGGEVNALGILQGTVERFNKLKVPHMGWNTLDMKAKNCPFLKNVKNAASVYFCHSYYVKPNDASIIATTTSYGINFTSSVFTKNIFAVQFHPEKSQSVGLNILKNFVEMKS